MHGVHLGLILKGNCEFRWLRKIRQKQDVFQGQSYSRLDGAHDPPRGSQSTAKQERHSVISVT